MKKSIKKETKFKTTKGVEYKVLFKKPNKRWFPTRKPDKVESKTQLLDKIKQYLPKVRSSKGLAEDLPNINMTDRELKLFLNEYYKLGTEDDPYDYDDDFDWSDYGSIMKWEEVLQK